MGKKRQQPDATKSRAPLNLNALIPLLLIVGLMFVIQIREGADAIPEPAWGAVGMIIGYLVGGSKSDS